MRLLARKLIFSPIDFWETITLSRHKYEPPKGDVFIGSGDFIMQGIQHLNLLKIYADLKPEDVVLDIGSGIGRTAVALTTYLSKNGKYEGFDVVEKGVKWCNAKIKKDYPNFNFTYVPLKNDLYNDERNTATEFVFPYANNNFDKAFLFSVFTHMSPDEIQNYLCEIKRTLKPGGLCLATFFIYNSNNESSIESNINFPFTVNNGNHRLMSNKVKSANIAFKEDFLNELISKAQLKKIRTIDGYWKNQNAYNENNDFQDIVILEA